MTAARARRLEAGGMDRKLVGLAAITFR